VTSFEPQATPDTRRVVQAEIADDAALTAWLAKANTAQSLRFSLVLQSGVTEIPWETLAACPNLAALLLPEGLTEITQTRIQFSSGFEKLVLPSTLRVIPADAFRGCNNLREVICAEGLEEIGANAFDGCSNLVSIELPNSLRRIGMLAFAHCDALRSFSVPPRVDFAEYIFYSVPLAGIVNLDTLIFRGKDTPLSWPPLRDCENLQRMVFLDRPPQIQDAEILRSRVFPPEFKIYYLTKNKYFWAPRNETEWMGFPIYAIESIEDLPPLGPLAYAYTTKEVDISSNEALGDFIAFAGENELRDVWLYITDEVTEVPWGDLRALDCVSVLDMDVRMAFPMPLESWLPRGLRELRLYDISYGNSWDEALFYDLPDMRIWDCKVDLIVENNLLMNRAKTRLYDCGDSLTHVVLPDTIREIMPRAFRNHGKLEEVVCNEGLLFIGKYAFYQCANLQSVQFPQSLLFIGETNFAGCDAMKVLRLPPLVRLGGQFGGGIDLQGCFETIIFEGSLPDIDRYNFDACKNLRQLVFLSGPPRVQALDPAWFAEDVHIYYLMKNRMLWAPKGETEWFGIPMTPILSLADLPGWGVTG